MCYDAILERDQAIEEMAAKYDRLLKICQDKKAEGICYCEENKERILMHIPKPNYTMCDVCFDKLQDDEDWHHKANFLKKSWTEESIDPGP